MAARERDALRREYFRDVNENNADADRIQAEIEVEHMMDMLMEDEIDDMNDFDSDEEENVNENGMNFEIQVNEVANEEHNAVAAFGAAIARLP